MQRKKHIYKMFGYRTSKKNFEHNRKCYKSLGVLGGRITIEIVEGIDGTIYHKMHDKIF